MPNHILALIKTPQPNLCRGMQHWLSGYANWYAKRNRRTGHLFQGRYKAFPIEDEATAGIPAGISTSTRVTEASPLRISTKHRQRGIVSTAAGRSVVMWRHAMPPLDQRDASRGVGQCDLSHPDSASDLIKRGKRSAESDRKVWRKLWRKVTSIEKSLGLNPESRV